MRSDQVTGRTWGARGATPVVRRTGNRFSANAMSAISTRGRMHFMVFTETFDAKAMCRFLARIVGHFDHKVHLIVDRHSAHGSKTVRTWLAGRKVPDRAALPALVLARTEPGRAGQRRPLTQPAPHPPGQEPDRTRRRNPQVLPQAPAPAPHRPRLLRRPPRPLRPGREAHEFLIKMTSGVGPRANRRWNNPVGSRVSPSARLSPSTRYGHF
ncbi:transposase [Streptomyces vietnamensis]|uniref:transposase n=1 Tax=Streptomyces vietnamensis TaxID=362257 RepID=UPI003F4D5E4D